MHRCIEQKTSLFDTVEKEEDGKSSLIFSLTEKGTAPVMGTVPSFDYFFSSIGLTS